MRMNTLLVLLSLLTLTVFLIGGCKAVLVGQNASEEQSKEFPVDIGEIIPGENRSVPEEEVMIPEEGIIIEATEGDLVELKPQAIDPDGDRVYYYFTEPFNENGRWQTKEGDAGQYLVTVTASDGKDNTSEDVLVIIHKANKAPVVECPEEVVVKEGETIRLDCNIYDPEGESVVVEYSGFMKGPVYKTTYDDAGEYTVQIKARDKEKESEAVIRIRVIDVNRAPEITGVPEEITVMETEIVSISPEVSDPDGDEMSITFSEPLNEKGIWKTKIGDAGTYKASIIASDGKGTAKKDFTIIVTQKNTPPVLKRINDITVYEGETINIPVDASDREGDELTVTVTGWMNSQTYTTTYDDAGEYTVTVIVSDGEYEAKQTFKVTVLDKNRPPIFRVPA